jgi:hypothetical protein
MQIKIVKKKRNLGTKTVKKKVKRSKGSKVSESNNGLIELDSFFDDIFIFVTNFVVNAIFLNLFSSPLYMFTILILKIKCPYFLTLLY